MKIIENGRRNNCTVVKMLMLQNNDNNYYHHRHITVPKQIEKKTENPLIIPLIFLFSQSIENKKMKAK